ncbi:DUF6541 family protein [Dactylosporangium sp. CA-092794]|uniref:DUF6541 family protein n=1 Tax=Dactylosporangium sp. CA-092794 TaxID=3239929 RepID=UPI003D8A97C1
MTIRVRVPARAVDVLVALGYVVGSVYVLIRLWADPTGRYLDLNYQDHMQFEWFLTHASQVFTRGESPFFSDDINSPLGVNLMANTSVLTLSLPMTPITLWLGPGVTFAILSTLALAGTAIAWYFVLTREFGRSRLAGAVGGAFLGFAPGMISQSAGHPNIAGLYLIPLIVAVVFRMRNPGRTWRQGLTLAALVVLQAGINEEMVFFTALALAVFVLAYVPWRQLPGMTRTVLPKFGVTLVAAGVVLAYPLHFQFLGPQAYHGLDAGVRAINLDALSYVTFGRFSIAGDLAEAVRLNRNAATEENSFFGWPLVLLLVAAVIVLWRNRLFRALFITGAVFAVMSLGDIIRVNGVDHTHVHGPWRWISRLPLFDSVVPTRLGLIVTVVVGLSLALLVDRLIVEPLRPAPDPAPVTPEPEPEPELEKVPALVGTAQALEAPPAAPARPAAPPASPAPGRARRRLPAVVWSVAVLAALVPLFPLPQPVNGRTPPPALFTDGNWRTKLPPNPVVAPLPGGWDDNIAMMAWSTSTNFEVKLTAGYFLGPNDTVPGDKYGHFGPGYRPTVMYMNWVRGQRTVPEPTAEQRTNVWADIRFWKATNLVIPANYPNVEVMRRTVDKLVAPDCPPGQLVDGVWLWDVRAISGAG